MNAPPEELTLTRDSYDKGPGERLREARMAAALSLEEMSARLHLDRRRIEFLEADDYAQLPAPTFVRGYLRSYARLLDLPPGPIIEAFDRRGFAPPALIADIATQAETRSTDLWVVSVTVGIGTLLVVLAAVWFQTQRSGDFEGSGLARPTQDAVLTPAGRRRASCPDHRTSPAGCNCELEFDVARSTRQFGGADVQCNGFSTPLPHRLDV